MSPLGMARVLDRHETRRLFGRRPAHNWRLRVAAMFGAAASGFVVTVALTHGWLP